MEGEAIVKTCNSTVDKMNGIVPFEEELIQRLIGQATKAKANSYSPYSKFRVGCAVLGLNGIYPGTNVENASYGLTICAERVAICNAVTNGEKEIKAIAVVTDLDIFKWCCGACLSFILEFGEEVVIISAKSDGKYDFKYIRELAPFCFSKKDLKMELK